MKNQQTFTGTKELYLNSQLEVIEDHTQARYMAGVKYTIEVISETEEDTNAQSDEMESDIDIEYYMDMNYTDVSIQKEVHGTIKKYLQANLY